MRSYTNAIYIVRIYTLYILVEAIVVDAPKENNLITNNKGYHI